MNQTGDAAEQIVNMATNVTVKGVEVVSNLAGKGALSLATFLIAALKDQKRTRGKTRMQAFNGKPTKVFVIKTGELKRFAEEARKYGVLYARGGQPQAAGRLMRYRGQRQRRRQGQPHRRAVRPLHRGCGRKSARTFRKRGRPGQINPTLKRSALSRRPKKLSIPWMSVRWTNC